MGSTIVGRGDLMASFADKLYPKLPTFAQHVAVSAWGFAWKWRRFGGEFTTERDAFIARENYNLEQWRAYQTRMLREILRLASRAPHYGSLKLDTRAIDRFELSDLGSLPILEKAQPRANPEAFLVPRLFSSTESLARSSRFAPPAARRARPSARTGRTATSAVRWPCAKRAAAVLQASRSRCRAPPSAAGSSFRIR
jgi:hypothetical protein